MTLDELEKYLRRLGPNDVVRMGAQLLRILPTDKPFDLDACTRADIGTEAFHPIPLYTGLAYGAALERYAKRGMLTDDISWMQFGFQSSVVFTRRELNIAWRERFKRGYDAFGWAS